MDRIDIKCKLKELFGKYKYVLLILLLGIILMSLPEDVPEPEQAEPSATRELPATRAEELEDILSQIAGVGKVRVLLTESAGAENIYQADEDRSVSGDTQSTRTETVIITNGDREEQALIRTVSPPRSGRWCPARSPPR